MSGVSGIVLFKPVIDAESIIKRMSDAIQHRGQESLHQFIPSKNSAGSAVVSIRALEQNTIFVESKPTHIHIIDSFTHPNEFQNSEPPWVLDTFRTLIIQIDSKGLRIFRSGDGICGLYYAQIENAVLFASEKKSIWAIGQDNVNVLEPGHTLSVTWSERKVIIQPLGLIRPRIDESIDKVTAIKKLEDTLLASFSSLPTDQKCAVLFSGGVDSALVAKLTRKYCKETLLITAVCEGSHDEVAAVRAAELLDLSHVIVNINTDSIWQVLPNVIYSIETCDRMNVEISLPFFFAAEAAKQRGFNLLVSGQGPDELFAGYARYEKLLKERGPERVQDALWNDVLTTHEVNIQRDARVIAATGLDVFFPYIFPPFVRTAMSLPATMKMDLLREPSRKIIFRELAEYMGIPNEITSARKRATQYSSGISKLLNSTVMEQVESSDKVSKRNMPALVQGVLDTIATHLQMPLGKQIRIAKLDLEPTRKLMGRVGLLPSSD
ncbi:MAG: asparagine synthase family protein [Candidatus Thorarchaeota archaeon]